MKNLTINILFACVFACVCAMSVSAACDDEAKKTDNWTKALADCQKATAKNPTSNDARFFVIYYAQELRLWDIAIAEQTKVIEIERKNPAYYLNQRYENLAQLYTFNGDYENARLAYLKAADAADDPEKYQVFAKALEANIKSGFKRSPEEKLDEKTIRADQELLEQIGRNSGAGKNEEALNDVNNLLKRRQFMANAYAVRGIIEFQLRKFQEAVKDHEMATKLRPWESLFNSHLVDAYTKINNYDGCIEAASRVIANHDSFEGDGFQKRGDCEFEKHDYKKAHEDYLQADWIKHPNLSDSHFLAPAYLETDCKINFSDDVTANYNRANGYFTEKKYLCSINFFDIGIGGSNTSALGVALAQYYRALAYANLRKGSYAFTTQAIRDYNRAVASGKLDQYKITTANFLAGAFYQELARLSTVKTTQIIYYEFAFQKMEAGLNAETANEKELRTVDLFRLRCEYANLLIDRIADQKSKSRTEDAAKLMGKLKAVVPKIETEYESFDLEGKSAAAVDELYDEFKNNYDEFMLLWN